MQRKLPSLLDTLGIKVRLGIRKFISFHLNTNEPETTQSTISFLSHTQMQEEIIRFIRGLVGCDSLSGSKIETALTAAGAHDRMPDGNRLLAQLGHSASSLVIDHIGCRLGLSRGMKSHTGAFMHIYRHLTPADLTSRLRSHVNGEKHRADIAKRAGFDHHLQYNPRPGGKSSKVLALATSALVGAVYQEKEDLRSVLEALYRLG